MRQTDPDRGPSPWKRGVRQDSQILICPGCQDSHDWKADLDRCSQCSSVHLVRRLGEVECRDCGAIVPPVIEDLVDSGLNERPATRPSPDLSEEVARALERVLGRSLVNQSARPGGGAEPASPARPRAVTG